MSEILPRSVSVGYGDFRRGTLIVDCEGVRVLRDPYSAKPIVLFNGATRAVAACRISTPSSW
ncbi:hypothetical protein [Rhodopseudomonas palustris]|uniref:hypothetical protein n=1 Tax=Rhodopseudomonas palustris TaxID=1076 RepID=UPI00064225CD